MTKEERVSEKFAVVTGASSGIGLELAKQCLSNGYHVLMVADEAEIHSAANQLQGNGQAEALQADLATEEGVTDTLSWTKKSARSPP